MAEIKLRGHLIRHREIRCDILLSRQIDESVNSAVYTSVYVPLMRVSQQTARL